MGFLDTSSEAVHSACEPALQASTAFPGITAVPRASLTDERRKMQNTGVPQSLSPADPGQAGIAKAGAAAPETSQEAEGFCPAHLGQ